MIRCEGLVKIFKIRDLEVVALQGLNLQVDQGEVMAIIGSSGSGKSTLLNVLGGLDRPSAGKAVVAGKDLMQLSAADRVRYKREIVGFVWQNNSRNLLPYLTVRQNVELPLYLSGRDRGTTWELLRAVGMEARSRHRLTELSGGEQQRTAIAIALANQPRVLLADEPTGSLDSANASLVLETFREVSRKLGVTVVMVTHDMSVAESVDRIVEIRDGMTSTEWLRTRGGEGEEPEDAFAGETHVQYSVVDKVGRLQIPREMLERLGSGNRVKLSMEGERRIVIEG